MENRQHLFQFRINNIERQLLSDLAKRLQRSRSDSLRLLIREAVNALDLDAEINKPSESIEKSNQAEL